LQDFRKLDVWRRSHAFVLRIYTISRQFPTEERFGMCSQIRQAAMGSASEVEYSLLLARDLKIPD
jgi:hypothetical protein